MLPLLFASRVLFDSRNAIERHVRASHWQAKGGGSSDDLEELLRLAAASPPAPPSSAGQAGLVKRALVETKRVAPKKPAAKAKKTVVPKTAVKKPMKGMSAMKARGASTRATGVSSTAPAVPAGMPEASTPRKVNPACASPISPATAEKTLKNAPKNVYSRAYHRVLQDEKKKGLSDEEAKVLARAAGASARDMLLASGGL